MSDKDKAKTPEPDVNAKAEEDTGQFHGMSPAQIARIKAEKGDAAAAPPEVKQPPPEPEHKVAAEKTPPPKVADKDEDDDPRKGRRR